MEQVTLAQGRVNYRDTGSGPPVVLVHGLLASGTLWRDVVPALAERFRCIIPELPLGAHEVPMNPGADLTPPGLAKLLADFMAELDLSDVTLVGNDTGGALCQLVAVHHPERLARLVLMSCDTHEDFLPLMFRPLQWIARVPGGVAAAVQPTRIAALHNTPLGFGMLTKGPIDRERTRGWLRPVLNDGGVRRDVRKVLRGIDNRHTLDAAERLKQFDKPTLIAWGAEDRVFKLKNAKRLAEAMPNAQLETIPDSGTFVGVDQPARTAALIADFAGGGGKAAGKAQQRVA